MAVYVDPLRLDGPYSWNRMYGCYMIADSTEELTSMAEKIGATYGHLRPIWEFEYFCLFPNKRIKAIENGAIEISRKSLENRLGHRFS